MANLFALFALVSLVLLVVGLIKPSWIRFKSRWLVALVMFGAVIVFSSLTTSFLTPEDRAKMEAEKQQAAIEADAKQAQQQAEEVAKAAEAAKKEEENRAELARIADEKAKQEEEARKKAEFEKADAQRFAEEKARQEAEAKKPVEYTATKLFKDYDANEVATDAKIGRNPVLVSGKIDSIDKNVFGSIVIQLTTPNQFMPARMMMEDSESGKAAALNKGQAVKILCKNMSRILGSPSGTSCTIP